MKGILTTKQQGKKQAKLRRLPHSPPKLAHTQTRVSRSKKGEKMGLGTKGMGY